MNTNPQLFSSAAALLGAAFLALGCSTGAPPPAEAPRQGAERPVMEVERYFPARHDTVYAYDTAQEDTGERGVLMLRVTRPRPDRADLTSGREVQRLSFGPDGIEFLEGGWLLKAPLEQGATWRGRMGQVRIERTDEITRVAAGTFTDCIVTVEEASSSTGSRRVTSVYCRDVGLVRLDVEAVTDSGLVHESAVLRSFGARIDIGAPAAQ